MEHLNKEEIIVLLDSDKIEKSIKDHLSNCDSCFSEYASIKSDYLELKNATLEKTPIEFLEKAEQKLNLNLTEDESMRSEGFLSNFFNKLNFLAFDTESSLGTIIFKPQLISVAMVATIILVVLYSPMKNLPNDNNSQLRGLTTQLFDNRMVLRSHSDSFPFPDDLKNMSESEILKYAENKRLLLELTVDGPNFSQIPQKGEPFNIQKDTLKIIISK